MTRSTRSLLRRRAALGLAALTLAGAGCFYPAERGRLIEAKVDKLQGENEALRQELEKTRGQLADTLPRVDEKIHEVSEALANLDKASRRSDADVGVQMQKQIEDLAQLRGQVESYLHKISELEDRITQLQSDTDQKLLAMQGPEAQKAAAAKKQLDGLQRPSKPKPFLDLAAQKAKSGDLLVARKLYDEFLRKWPRDTLAGEAHFGLGETWYQDQKCREALFEYGKVIQQFAKTKSAPEAYLRSSDCFAKLNMNSESKLALEEVVKSYPKSDAAKTAKSKLRALEKPAPKHHRKGRR